DGLLWLALSTYDRLERADPVFGRCLALLAVANRSNPGAHVREEALLASLMGYEAYARASAAKLPGEDPVRLFVQQDDNRLRSAASGGTARAQYLSLILRFSLSPSEEGLGAISGTHWGAAPSIATLAAALRGAEFETPRVGEELILLVRREVEGAS